MRIQEAARLFFLDMAVKSDGRAQERKCGTRISGAEDAIGRDENRSSFATAHTHAHTHTHTHGRLVRVLEPLEGGVGEPRTTDSEAKEKRIREWARKN